MKLFLFAISKPLRGPLALLLISMVVAIAAYLQALDFPLVSDDGAYLTSNAKLAGLQVSELWRLLWEPFNPYEFLPLRDFSYWLDMTLFGLMPSAMRIENIVLYLLSCLLVYGTTLKLWRYFNPAQAASAAWAAAVVTALFAIHPAHVESVVWISGRKDVLSGLFAMLALWLALDANGHGKRGASDDIQHARSPDKTTSHSTRLPNDGNQVAGYLPSPDGTTSHSTKPASGQVAGYLPQAGEGGKVSLREVHDNHKQGLSTAYAAASVFVLLAAMFAKATAAAVAPLIALLWLMFWRDMPTASRHRLQLLWIPAPLLLAAGVIPLFAQYSTVRLPNYWGVETITRACAVLGDLARLVLTPESRHYFYPVFESPWLPAMVGAGVAVLFAAVAGGVLLVRKRSLAGFVLLTFAMLCLPYMQLAPYITHTLVADRFLFLAVWPAILLLVALAWKLQPVLRIALLCVIAVPWIYQTVERPHDWRSFEELIEADLRAYPGSTFPVFQIIERQLSQGQYREARDMARTITDVEIRNIAIKLVEGAYAVAVDAPMQRDPRSAVVRLQSLGDLLKQPVAQAEWNTPLFSFWLTSRNILALEWETLARNFPEDALVRDQVKKRQEAGL